MDGGRGRTGKGYEVKYNDSEADWEGLYLPSYSPRDGVDDDSDGFSLEGRIPLVQGGAIRDTIPHLEYSLFTIF